MQNEILMKHIDINKWWNIKNELNVKDLQHKDDLV